MTNQKPIGTTAADQIQQMLDRVVPPSIRRFEEMWERALPPIHKLQTTLDRTVPPAVRHLQELLDRIRPPDTRELQRSLDRATPTLRYIKQVADSLQQGINRVVPQLLRDFQQQAEAFEKALQWFESAPEELGRALTNSTALPHPELSLPDLNSILVAFRASGGDSGVARLDELHRELLADSAFRKSLEERWTRSERRAVLTQVLRAHDAGLFGVAIPAAIAQAEGLLAEMIVAGGSPQPVIHKTIEARAREVIAKDRLLGPTASAFLVAFYQRFKHGDPETHLLQRHAVMHGGAWSYGVEANSLRAIVWLDCVLLAAAPSATVPPPSDNGSPQA
jgi:hypothetical protein